MATKRVAILQSNYIPWKGYFDLIRAVDLFIILDDAQFTKNDWRNRNRIKTEAGPRWLTIPVATAEKLGQRIEDTRVAQPRGTKSWSDAHWSSLRQSYARAPHFATFGPPVRDLLNSLADEPMLSRINVTLLRGLCDMMGIHTPMIFSRDLAVSGRRGERVLALCQAAGATHYLSGPAARAYIEPRMFSDAGIELAFADYTGYLEYPQLHGAFEHAVSVLDLLFNVGPDAQAYMKPLGIWA